MTVPAILQLIFLKGGFTRQKTKNMLFLCNFGYLLVPELIMKGLEVLDIANFQEMFIGTVNLTKNLARSADSSSFMDKGPN